MQCKWAEVLGKVTAMPLRLGSDSDQEAESRPSSFDQIADFSLLFVKSASQLRGITGVWPVMHEWELD